MVICNALANHDAISQYLFLKKLYDVEKLGPWDGETIDTIRVTFHEPYAFSIVDIFGSMMKSDLLRIYL